jgi:integrase
MANKVRNNWRQVKGNWYYRLMVWNGKRQHEWTIPFKTKDKKVANNQYQKFLKPHIADIKSGVIQKFQLKALLPWLNKEKTSEIVELSLERVIPDYLTYKESKLRAKSVKRDSASLNQLCEFVGYSKPVAELTYLDIEGSKGLIQHLLSKGYRNNGINVTLRHLKAFFTWLHKKEQVLDKTIEFDMLPKGEQEYYIDEYQIQAIHNYIDDDSNGIDSFFKRCFIFYEFTGVRALEPFIGEMYGDWLYVDASKSKGKNLRKIHLSKDLKAILMEMHAFRDEYVAMDSTEPNERACERISKTLLKIRRAINFNTNRKITLKSFRHHYGITRVYTTGNIFQVAMEMGHKNVTTTQEYLRFQADEIKDHFPSLIPIIENMENMQKSGSMVTKSTVTEYSKDNKLPSSLGRLSSRLP